MREEVATALLESFDARDQAAEMQIERGTVDAGSRGQVTSGKHMDALVDVIVSDLIAAGAPPDGIRAGNGTDLPGWFRASKKWDILALDHGTIMAAIELKSIGGSYGNNLNNRSEEAIGESVDLSFVLRRGLIAQTIPPILGYVMVVKRDEASSTMCGNPAESHFGVDPEFLNSSCVDRFGILCRRLRSEELYGAVWFVTVDPVSREILEPDPDLAYDRFIAEIGGRISAFKARRPRLPPASSPPKKVSWAAA